MIALKFNIPLEKVEDRSIVEYRLLLFTVFNSAALDSGMGGFKFQTDEEEMSELDAQIAFFKTKGFF